LRLKANIGVNMENLYVVWMLHPISDLIGERLVSPPIFASKDRAKAEAFAKEIGLQYRTDVGMTIVPMDTDPRAPRGGKPDLRLVN